MAKVGISVPLRANKAGSVVNSTNSQHVAGLLSVALNSGDSDNPFQQPGLNDKIIFELADEVTFTRVADRIEEIFEDFEENELASLQDRQGNLKPYNPKGSPGEYGLRVYYIDLQTDKPDALSVFAGAGGLVVSTFEGA